MSTLNLRELSSVYLAYESLECIFNHENLWINKHHTDPVGTSLSPALVCVAAYLIPLHVHGEQHRLEVAGRRGGALQSAAKHTCIYCVTGSRVSAGTRLF